MKKGLTFLLIFTSPGEKKRSLKAGVQFFNTVFKNPDIHIKRDKKNIQLLKISAPLQKTFLLSMPI